MARKVQSIRDVSVKQLTANLLLARADLPKALEAGEQWHKRQLFCISNMEAEFVRRNLPVPS